MMLLATFAAGFIAGWATLSLLLMRDIKRGPKS